MKVKLSFTVEIDPEEWMNSYFVERGEVRDDVKTYCEYMLVNKLKASGMWADSDEGSTQ